MKILEYKISHPWSDYAVTIVIMAMTSFFLLFALLWAWRMYKHLWTMPLVISFLQFVMLVIFASVLCSLIRRMFSLESVRFHNDGKAELIRRDGAVIQCSIPADVVRLCVSKNDCSIQIRCNQRVYVVGTRQIDDGLGFRHYLAERIPMMADLLKQQDSLGSRHIVIPFRLGKPINAKVNNI